MCLRRRFERFLRPLAGKRWRVAAICRSFPTAPLVYFVLNLSNPVCCIRCLKYTLTKLHPHVLWRLGRYCRTSSGRTASHNGGLSVLFQGPIRLHLISTIKPGIAVSVRGIYACPIDNSRRLLLRGCESPNSVSMGILLANNQKPWWCMRARWKEETLHFPNLH